MANPFRPFANGCQAGDWILNNCSHCTRWSFADDPATGKQRAPLDEDQVCQIELALFNAQWGDGTVPEDIAKRMDFVTEDGSKRSLDYGWRCGEFERVPEVRR